MGWGQVAYAARRTFCIHMLNIYSQAKQSVNYVGVSLSHSHSLPFSLSLFLPLHVSRSLPGSCIFNPLSSSLSQGTRHVEQQLRFFSSFWGIRLFYDALAPTCCNRLRGTRRSLEIAPSPPPLKSVNHICHMRDFQHVI